MELVSYSQCLRTIPLTYDLAEGIGQLNIKFAAIFFLFNSSCRISSYVMCLQKFFDENQHTTCSFVFKCLCYTKSKCVNILFSLSFCFNLVITEWR